MSELKGASRQHLALRTLRTLAALGLVVAAMAATAHYARSGADPGSEIAALGFLLLAGGLCAELLEPLGLPHLTGYLAAGVVAGPHVLRLVPEETVAALQTVNGLALALIAFSAGAELSVGLLRRSWRSISYAVVGQTVVPFVALAATFFLARSWMPFLGGQSQAAVLGLALLWGVVAVVKSPSAVLGILAETRAEGPLTTYAIAMVVVLDVVVLILFQVVLAFSRTLVEPGAVFTFAQLGDVGHEFLGSVALGTTLGLIAGLYLAFVNRGVILFLVALAFSAAQLDRYFGYDAMMVFIVAGFVVQNLTQQGEKLLDAIRSSSSVIYVVFFANAGAHLDLPALASLWPVALLLAGVRVAATAGAASAASTLANDPPAVRRWGWSSLVSQAGIALGIAVAAESAFPAIGPGFRSLAVAVIGFNEALGPVLFKLGLSRAGELNAADRVAGGT